MAGAVFQPAGAAKPGQAVLRTGQLPQAQGQPVRAHPHPRRRGPAPGAGPAERQGGGGAQRGQGDHPAPGGQQPAELQGQPLPQAVLPGPGHSRAGQCLALPLQRPDRGVFPQRRHVPLPAPAAQTRLVLPGAGPLDPPAPAVRAGQRLSRSPRGPQRLAGAPAPPEQPGLAQPVALAAGTGRQPGNTGPPAERRQQPGQPGRYQ
ncbi:hypothetical protein D3C76_1224590 [compost metagenome]